MSGDPPLESVADRRGVSTADSDADLLAAHVAGDADAFALLLTRHQDRLWAVALAMMRNSEDAADALQDAYLRVFRRAGTFRGEAQVTTWLHRIVVNACLDRLRRIKVRAADPLPDGLGEDVPDVDSLERWEESRRVLVALGQLSADQRAALILVDMEGYSVDEAAAMLGCPPGTVKSRCARGRARLVPLLGPDGPPLEVRR